MDLYDRVEEAVDVRPVAARSLGGGCGDDVRRLDFADGASIVAKMGDIVSRLSIEGRMLNFLRSKSALPVPEVLFAADDLLLMTWLEGGDAVDGASEIDAADHIAALHGITAATFGHSEDTLIGGLHQPNPHTQSWREFFRDQRLMYMAGVAREAGRLPPAVFERIEALAGRLESWIDDGSKPSLIHGDLWGGNVLARQGRISGFIDPAVYFADAEIELAFSTLFNTFGDDFFGRYREHRAIAPGFFEERRDLYNLYPLLVHVRLFGGGYVAAVERTLSRFGV